jgi:signal transduction histidine kinase
MDSTRYHKIQLEATSLQSVMNDVLLVARDRIALTRIIVDTTYSAKEAMAMVDKEKLRIAFLNLIINAIEAIEDRVGTISIAITSKQDFHLVTIQDSGCGMTEETAQKLFEPYYTTKATGLGLGLATTYAIIISHKATINVSSVIGQGSTFTLAFLPFQD